MRSGNPIPNSKWAGQNWTLESERPTSEFQFHHLLLVWVWASYLPSLNLGFLIFKMTIIIISNSLSVVKIKCNDAFRVLKYSNWHTVFSGIMLGITIIIINVEGGLWWPAQYFVNRCLGWGNWRHTYQVPNFIYAAINLFRHHLTFLWFIFCSYGWTLHLFQFNSIFPIPADWFSFLKSLSLPYNMLVSYQNYKKKCLDLVTR